MLYSPSNTLKYGMVIVTCSSRVAGGVEAVLARMVNARFRWGSQRVTVSKKSTPPIPSCNNVASTGRGKPMRRVQESRNSAGRIAGASLIWSHLQSTLNYDALNRLTTSPITKGSTITNYTYPLDQIGNRQSGANWADDRLRGPMTGFTG